MQLITSGKSATMSLLLIVMFATMRLRAIFLAEWFLSFLPPLCSSARSSATLPCVRRYGKFEFGPKGRTFVTIGAGKPATWGTGVMAAGMRYVYRTLCLRKHREGHWTAYQREKGRTRAKSFASCPPWPLMLATCLDYCYVLPACVTRLHRILLPWFRSSVTLCDTD
jgi:hypothetical protein